MVFVYVKVCRHWQHGGRGNRTGHVGIIPRSPGEQPDWDPEFDFDTASYQRNQHSDKKVSSEQRARVSSHFQKYAASVTRDRSRDDLGRTSNFFRMVTDVTNTDTSTDAGDNGIVDNPEEFDALYGEGCIQNAEADRIRECLATDIAQRFSRPSTSDSGSFPDQKGGSILGMAETVIRVDGMHACGLHASESIGKSLVKGFAGTMKSFVRSKVQDPMFQLFEFDMPKKASLPLSTGSDEGPTGLEQLC